MRTFDLPDILTSNFLDLFEWEYTSNHIVFRLVDYVLYSCKEKIIHVGPHLLLGLFVSQSFKVGALQNFRRRLQTQKVWPAAKLCSSAALSRHRPHSAWTWRLQQQVSLIITALNNLIIGFSPVKRSGIVMAESMDCYMYTSCQRTLRIECNKSIGVNNISEHIFKFLFYSQTPWI